MTGRSSQYYDDCVRGITRPMQFARRLLRCLLSPTAERVSGSILDAADRLHECLRCTGGKRQAVPLDHYL